MTMTVKEAMEQGYKVRDWAYHRGYIKRRGYVVDEQEVFEGGGNRKGWLYYCAPCQNSSQYFIRYYLKKEGE